MAPLSKSLPPALSWQQEESNSPFGTPLVIIFFLFKSNLKYVFYIQSVQNENYFLTVFHYEPWPNVFLLILKLAYQCKKPKTLNRACERPSLKMGRLKKVWCKRKIVLISILVMAIYSLVCHANTWFISDIKRLEGFRVGEREGLIFFSFRFLKKKVVTRSNQTNLLV